jgi:hypothetical protein
MRVFADLDGRDWTVFEVKKQGGRAERWTYLPEEFGEGWLCFESDISKRRLTPIPPRWREFSDTQLAGLLKEAKPVSRPRLDLEDHPSAD